MNNLDIQKQSYRAGLAAGNDPATPYGILAPQGLDPVAFAAGLIEGRASVRRRQLEERDQDFILAH